MRWICCILTLFLIRAYFLRYAAASDGYAGANYKASPWKWGGFCMRKFNSTYINHRLTDVVDAIAGNQPIDFWCKSKLPVLWGVY